MCSLYSQISSLETISKLFGATAAHLSNLPMRPEIYPGREAAIIRTTIGGEREVTTALWGFPPPGGQGDLVSNVRNLRSPYWRPWLGRAEQRCLVPVDAFAEWSAQADPVTRRKTRMWFSMADEAERPFAFAGVWRPGVDNGDPPRMAFLTTMPNRVVANVHHKSMPVILRRTNYALWLEGSAKEIAGLARALPDEAVTILSERPLGTPPAP